MNNFSDWRDLIQTIAAIFAIGMSIFAVIRSSKDKQNDELREINKQQTESINKIKDALNDHMLQDSQDISTLKANVANLQNICNEKLDKILDEIEKK
jgi:hypothetical protein